MEPVRLLVAVILACGATACISPAGDAPGGKEDPAMARQGQSLDDTPPPCPEPTSPSCVPVSEPISPADACPMTRWIAVLADDDVQGCPPGPSSEQEGGWQESQLFGGSTSGYPLPPGLAPFCAYTWVPATSSNPLPSQKAVTALHEELGTRAKKLNRDCQVVAPMGTSATTRAAWPELLADFHAQTGRLARLPDGGQPGPVQVRVAVVDSSPHRYNDGDAVPDRLGHGHAMGRIIRELGCPDEKGLCLTQVANHLALPQVTPTVKDPVRGGYFGELTRLAQAIHAAVSEWRAHNAGNGPEGQLATPQPRLVINLSLAWDGRYGGPYVGNDVDSLSAPVRAVHAAITHAVCNGALVISAAGNDPGGPDVDFGPMFPAAWEQKPSPGRPECTPLEDSNYVLRGPWRLFPPSGSNAYRPLVHAVGAVKGNDKELDNARPGGRPRIAAPGAHGLATDTLPDGGLVTTDILSGSSVATAVASAVAATTWAYQPALSGPEVMEVVRLGSAELGVPADFCLGGRPCPLAASDPSRFTIRRVSLCEAVEEACRLDGGRCPGPVELDCPDRGPYASPLPQLSTWAMDQIVLAMPRTVDGSTLNVELPTEKLGVCQLSSLHSSVWRYDPTICPNRQYYGIPLRPWTGPQPAKDPCSFCLVDIDPEESLALAPEAPTATLYISIDSDFETRTMGSPSLRLNGVHVVDLSERLADAGVKGLTAGSELRVTGIPLDAGWYPIEKATLELRGVEDGGPYSTSSVLLVQ